MSTAGSRFHVQLPSLKAKAVTVRALATLCGVSATALHMDALIGLSSVHVLCIL
jgi:hypothetical protein